MFWNLYRPGMFRSLGGCLRKTAVAMDIDEYLTLEEKAARCRRIAAMMTDDEIRHSLEELALEYEARLKLRNAGFMLQGSERGARRTSSEPAANGRSRSPACTEPSSHARQRS